MNTNLLKSFAQEARTKLMTQIAAKLEMVLTTDSSQLREQATQIEKLNEAISATSKEQVVDKVAYTWFNRFMALRFMDANGYQPIGVQVISPKEGYTLPELLDEAKQGHIPTELNVDHERINDLLNGKIQSNNPQNEVYKMLLIAACNHLNKVFPFLFEHINNYTELLLPDDLTSEFSILQDVRDGMTDEDCSEVEIIGWLYQFYISEVNDELISSKKKYRTEDLAPASQLFTPKWIVQYMVDNTLGQLWSEINPNTNVTDSLEFYIKPAYKEQLPLRTKKNIEEIKFFEPCVGSGHILSYAFDVFYKMYEEQGYNPTEIPELIITKNLYGVDIDQRAAQLASFVLLMKGRQKQRRFLRAVETKNIQPNITFFQNFDFDEKFENAAALGSLITVKPDEAKAFNVEASTLFGEQQAALKKLYTLLGQRYDVVVTNPPYIGSNRMEADLKKFIDTNYPDTKSDMFATFVVRCLELCNDEGLTGYMTPFVWMFISSYQKLREIIIDNHFINNLIQLEYSGFDGATVPICTFTLRKQSLNEEAKGSYIRLSDFRGSQNQAPKTLEAIQNPDCGWFYTANQKDFEKIPGSPIGYWLSENVLNNFTQDKLKKSAQIKKGLSTGSVDRFMRFWHEVTFNLLSFEGNKKCKWFPYMKGGGFRRWDGNLNYVVNWFNSGSEVINFRDNKGKQRSRPQNVRFYFNQGITYSALTSYKFSTRFMYEYSIFGGGGDGIFIDDEIDVFYMLGLLNSSIAQLYLNVISPTLNYEVSHIQSIPILVDSASLITDTSENCVSISKTDWDSCETSWDFQQNELIKQDYLNIEEAYQQYQHHWQQQFYKLHSNEEELNKQFIGIYGLQDELTPDVPLEDITILKDELLANELKELSTTYKSGWQLINGEWQLNNEEKEKPDLPFDAREVMRQFVSYAVGCLFGRYSLDKEGLILANQGETLEDYIAKVGLPEAELQFVPDEDNIIPILDDEWFKDDMVGLFNAFLKRSFGKENFEQNLAFVEDSLGRDMRNYFLRDFYTDHVRRYKKRPIYWLFSSPKGSFNVLIYMHRYTPDTLNRIFNNYLAEYREKLKMHSEQLNHVIEKGEGREQTQAAKELDKIKAILLELQEYERDILYPLATERIAIDLDDGVLVNYNKFGSAIKQMPGLNDKATKKKVKGFDWIDGSTIR